MELSKKIIQITCMSFNHGFIYAKKHILDILSKQQYVKECVLLNS